jgi:hypothetical protein
MEKVEKRGDGEGEETEEQEQQQCKVSAPQEVRNGEPAPSPPASPAPASPGRGSTAAAAWSLQTGGGATGSRPASRTESRTSAARPGNARGGFADMRLKTSYSAPVPRAGMFVAAYTSSPYRLYVISLSLIRHLLIAYTACASGVWRLLICHLLIAYTACACGVRHPLPPPRALMSDMFYRHLPPSLLAPTRWRRSAKPQTINPKP